MKRIFFILTFLFLAFFVKGQYPITQNIGSSSTLVQVPANGALRAVLINRSFTDTATANSSNADYYSGSQIFTTSDQIFWVRNAAATAWINLSAGGSAGELLPFYGCVSGCTVTWIQNYDYEVAASVYYIGGVRYESPAATVTLDASDPTNDRIDVFVLTTSGVADNVTGTPSANPLEPDIDPLTQLGVSFALVTAASTEPTIANNWIYRENAGPPAEWTMATVAASINLASTNFPYAGTRDIEATNMPALASFTATSSTTVTWGNYDALVFKIRSKGNWTQSRPMYIYIYSSSGGVKKGPVILTTGQYGFNSSTTGSYQNITIPLSDFGALTSSDDIIQFARTGGSGTIGWYIDDIQLTNINYEPPVGSGTVTNVSIANLSPLFLATVNNPTTAPSIFFTLMDGAGGTVFGNTQNVNASPAYTATPILGRTGTTGTLGFRGATSGTVTITPAAAAGTWTLTLPTDDGDANQVLQTNGSGVTSWATVSGTVTSFAFTDGNGFDGTVTNSTTTPTLSLTTTVSTDQLMYSSSGAVTGDANITRSGAGAITVGTSVTSPTIIGGTGTTSDLILQPTSGVGTTGSDIYFRNGNNGASTRFTIFNSGNALFGAATSASTATPVSVSFGGTYGIGAVGSSANLKWKLYDDGTATNDYGIGMSAAMMNLRAGTNGSVSISPNNGTLAITFNTASETIVGASTDRGAYTFQVNGTSYLSDVLNMAGSSSGVVTIQTQAAAGTFNFNLPTTAGTSGYLLTSGGGGATAMTWTDPATIGGITADNGLTESTTNNVQLGGTLLQNTTITQSTFNLTFGSSATTGTTTSSALVFTGNSLTSGTGFYLSSTSLSSGSLLDLSVNSTAAASNLQKGINVSLSGANATASQTTYGIYSSNSHSGSTSLNYGGYFTSTNATTNVAVYGTGSTYGLQGVTTSGSGVRGEATTGNGVNGLATGASSYGGYFESAGSGGVGIYAQANVTNGIGVWGASTVGIGGQFNVNPSSTNTAIDVIRLFRTTSGTPAAGLGGKILFNGEVSDNSSQEMGSLHFEWTDVTLGSRTSRAIIRATNNTTTADKFTISGLGYMKLNGITATAASALTAEDGMIVYVTDTDATFTSIGFWARENGVWNKL